MRVLKPSARPDAATGRLRLLFLPLEQPLPLRAVAGADLGEIRVERADVEPGPLRRELRGDPRRGLRDVRGLDARVRKLSSLVGEHPVSVLDGPDGIGRQLRAVEAQGEYAVLQRVEVALDRLHGRPGLPAGS